MAEAAGSDKGSGSALVEPTPLLAVIWADCLMM